MPFAITIDYQTVEDGTATLRERDSTAQVGGKGADAAMVQQGVQLQRQGRQPKRSRPAVQGFNVARLR